MTTTNTTRKRTLVRWGRGLGAAVVGYALPVASSNDLAEFVQGTWYGPFVLALAPAALLAADKALRDKRRSA